jgi:glycerate dehydrogenase
MTFKHHVIALDSWVNLPDFNFPYSLTVITDNSARTKPEQLKDATIAINSQVPVNAALLDYMPNLQLFVATGTGVDHIDKEACHARGITLCKTPAQNTDAVSEHAFALASALTRRILPMHQMVVKEEKWGKVRPPVVFGKPPRVNSEETLCIMGYGSLGRNIERIGRALGMRVIIAERKNATSIREGRTSFKDAIRQATLFILVVPGDDGTRNMISTTELDAMDDSAIIVNVGRSVVIDDAAIVQALRDGKIGGFATDVFSPEPATKETSILLDETIPNLILSPHIAWYSSKTIAGTIETVKKNIEGFVAGTPQNVVS